MNDVAKPKSEAGIFTGHLKIRLTVGVIMLALAFVGILLTYIEPITQQRAWSYWVLMAPVYAILVLGLSLYLRHKDARTSSLTIFHEIAHWAGLIGAVLIIHIYVTAGIVGRVEAGLFVLVLLAFSTFISGVYLDITFLIIGVTLALFAILLGWLTKYLAVVAIAIVVLAAITLYIILHMQHKKTRAKAKSAADDHPLT